MENVSAASVKQFTQYMNGLGRKGTYINGLLKSIKSFVQYCHKEGYGGFNTKRNFKWCKEEKPVIIAFRPSQVRQMLRDCNGYDFMSIRDKELS